ncbi:hypothetical protein KKF47_01665 [Patescibacteria group bacterium]|nr:hypothetical protein [Patescibacteria group bacterium]MBU4466754.1 hypothetical protein [Patescibacteria group bacterium]
MTSFSQKGLTFIEVLVGISLTLIIFLGIFGAYQLALKVIIQSRNKIVATAIASGEIEKIRNLPYGSIGIVNGFPAGSLLSSSVVSQNSANYTVNRTVDYVVSAIDGVASPDDDCPNDYKKVEVTVSWAGRYSGQVKLTTDVSPASLAQECSEIGGILEVLVFDAVGAIVSSPLIEIRDFVSDTVIKSATPVSGQHYFSLVPASYKIAVSKTGYSAERSFGSDEIATPKIPHPLVIEGQLTPISLAIDRQSSFDVTTLSLWSLGQFKDSFPDQSQISQVLNLSIAGGQVSLEEVGGEYQVSGYLISETIEPSNMLSWDEISFSQSKPELTQILYQVFYLQQETWQLVPNQDLSGNGLGFEVAPINLKNLSVLDYSQLRIKASLSTQNSLVTPTLFDWQLFWKTSEPTVIPFASFDLRGEKIIGHDSQEQKVYKYSQSLGSNSSGKIFISGLEWDRYYFSTNPDSDLSLMATNPETDPIDLIPNVSLPVNLYLKAQTSLLLILEDNLTLEPIFAGQAKLNNSQLGYDMILNTDQLGQAYFIPLEAATYNLEIQAPGYLSLTTQVLVSGDQIKIIRLEQIE